VIRNLRSGPPFWNSGAFRHITMALCSTIVSHRIIVSRERHAKQSGKPSSTLHRHTANTISGFVEFRNDLP